MKSIRNILLTTLMILGTSAAAPAAKPDGPPEMPAEIALSQPGIIEALVSENAIIDHVHDDSVTVYFTDEEYERAVERGWEIKWIPNQALEMWRQLKAEGQRLDDPFLDYHTYDEMVAELQNYEATYPNLCKMVSIGQSVQGRELWFLKISDNVNVEEDEPEFKYVSSMHGDEILGMELMLDLIDRLLTGYGTDTRMTNLVDGLEIWIMPLMNPDGWEWSSGPRRANANGFDLNRSFPRWSLGETNSTVGRQAEVVAMMNWMQTARPVMSANFHGGELVTNYPYDECPDGGFSCGYSATTDDALFQEISLVYASNNPRMFATPDFTNGITNGVDWYVAQGGMQDWNYIWHGCLELTIELDDDKIPAVSRVPGLVDENRESVIAYMEYAFRGIRGMVTDAQTGDPVDAQITIIGRDGPVYTDPDVGDFQRVIEPGTYTLEITSADFPGETITVENVVVTSGAATPVTAQFNTALNTGPTWYLY